MTTGIDGAYLLMDVPSGLQTIVARRQSYLRTWRQVAVPAGQTILLPGVTLLGGDIGGDDLISEADAASIVAAWNTTSGSPDWSAEADVTDDGEVNLLDIVAVEYNWGQQAPGPWAGP